MLYCRLEQYFDLIYNGGNRMRYLSTAEMAEKMERIGTQR